MDLELAWARYLRPTRVFLIAAGLGLLVGIGLSVLARPILNALEHALYFRITKPLEIIQGPLSGIVGTEAVTAFYLLGNNILVSFIAAFGGAALIRYTLKPDQESYRRQSRLTSLLRRLIGEGNQTYKEPSVLAFLLPLAVVFVNGGVFGLFSVSNGLSWKELYVYFAYVLPHGAVELPAVILAATIGYATAVRLDSYLERGDLEGFFKSAGSTLRSKRSWGLFSLVCLMLVLAAMIEAYVTPAVGRTAFQNSYFALEVLNESVPASEPAFLILWASFGATITFHNGSASGAPLPVELFGSERYPFEVDGRRVGPSEVVTASKLEVPDDVPGLLLKFQVSNASGATLVQVLASCRKLRDEANLTVLP